MEFRVRLAHGAVKFALRLCALTCVVLAMAATLPNLAQAADEELGSEWVEVRRQGSQDPTARELREGWGWSVSLGVENFRPEGFESTIDGATYSDIFGESDVQMFVLEGGLKYNLPSVSAMLGFNYGSGFLDGTFNGETREFTFERMTAKVSLIADGLTQEPYVAPYVSMGMYKLGTDEYISEADLDDSGETELGVVISMGALLQLNWMEPESSRHGRLESGLKNTFLDVFMTQYQGTSSEDDPDTATSFNWGAALRLEF